MTTKLQFIVKIINQTQMSTVQDDTRSFFYKQRFISNDFETSQILEKIKQRTSLFSKKLATLLYNFRKLKQQLFWQFKYYVPYMNVFTKLTHLI